MKTQEIKDFKKLMKVIKKVNYNSYLSTSRYIDLYTKKHNVEHLNDSFKIKLVENFSYGK